MLEKSPQGLPQVAAATAPLQATRNAKSTLAGCNKSCLPPPYVHVAVQRHKTNAMIDKQPDREWAAFTAVDVPEKPNPKRQASWPTAERQFEVQCQQPVDNAGWRM